MFDMEARKVIEALRSGIPSRSVGRYFSEARPQIMKELSGRLEAVCENDLSGGMIITGKYGEGKTHLLNTVFNMAHENNMVVSYLSVSKESPFDKLYLVYQKLMASTFLPGREQPGFLNVLEDMTANSPVASELLVYGAKELETDKLYYLLKAYLNTEDQEEKFQLQADLMGDFIANPALRKIYKRIFNTAAKFNTSFSKTKHCQDYFYFMSYLFERLGYQGWVILIDEAELMGRLGKKARLNAYRNIASFLMPDRKLISTFSLVAFSASYIEDVIEGKHEFENLAEIYPDAQEPARSVLNAIIRAPQLLPLSKEEVLQILVRIQEFHGRAYEWTPSLSPESMIKASGSGGFLLRTKLRAAIELLDQLYQYQSAGGIKIDELGRESYDVEVPSLEELNEQTEENAREG